MLDVDHFDDKLSNILKIKENHYDEACILIYVYLEYLAQFSNGRHSGNSHKENYRNFIMSYSSRADILRHIQIDRILNLFNTSEDKRRKYEHYLEPYREKFELIKNGDELGITDFLKIDDVEEKDKKFFNNFTLANRIYEFRNFAVHEYHNKVCEGLDSNEPILIYVPNVDENKEGWFRVLYPFEFLFEILYSCYKNVRADYMNFLETRYNG